MTDNCLIYLQKTTMLILAEAAVTLLTDQKMRRSCKFFSVFCLQRNIFSNAFIVIICNSVINQTSKILSTFILLSSSVTILLEKKKQPFKSAIIKSEKKNFFLLHCKTKNCQKLSLSSFYILFFFNLL